MNLFKTRIIAGLILCCIVKLAACGQSLPSKRQSLPNNWQLKSSVLVPEDGSYISTVEYKPQQWFKTSVPSTVLNALVKNGIYPDPRVGLNAYQIPDSHEEFNLENDLAKFSYLPDKRNPWRDPYWYRTEFMLDDIKLGQHVWLNFNCINYRSDVWLNGNLIASKDSMVGMFQRFRFDITEYAQADSNVLAVLIYPVDHPGKPDTQLKVFGSVRDYRKEIMKDVTEVMSIGYDCFPTIPDRNMGIIQDVFIDFTDPVDIKNPFIVTDLPLPKTNTANLTVSAELVNATNSPQKGILKGVIVDEGLEFFKSINLNPGETKEVIFTIDEYPQLAIENPRLWWPVNYGEQDLYNMSLSFELEGKISDKENVTFGIREITKELYELDGQHGLRFHVNGKKVFCRGGYIQPEMMFDWDKKRMETEIRYLAEANMNWISFEDIPNPPDEFLDLCDKYGLMFWNDFYGCFWLQPGTDYPSDIDLLDQCTIDLIKRYRNHPSITLYMSMNEGTTSEEVYKRWRKNIIQLDGTRLFIPSGSFPDYRGNVPEWIKQDLPVGMNDYSPKSYGALEPKKYYQWVREERNWMFMLESGSASLPPISSLKKFIPDLGETSEGAPYPLSKTWAHHGANSYYKPYDQMLRKEYGEPDSVEDYCRKGHLLTAEQNRAMFEAVNHRIWDITSGFGVWKLNSGWPSVQWQIYDWYLRPMVSYYYVKKASAPLVVQLNPIDSTVTIVNNSFEQKKGMEISAKIYDLSSNLLWKKSVKTDIGSNTYKDLFTLEKIDIPTSVYFVRLDLKDSEGSSVTDNFYWLSTETPDDFTGLGELPPAKLNMTYEIKEKNIHLSNNLSSETPDKFEGLEDLPIVNINLPYEIEKKGEENIAHITVENPTDKLAFFIHLILTKGQNGEEVLPIFWDDNYFTLLPKEKRELKATYAVEDLNGATPVIEVEGWNIPKKRY